MAQVFKDNPFPVHLYRADSVNGKFANDKKELEQLLSEGWSEAHVPRDYPRWVGPPDDQHLDPLTVRVVLTSRGGKVCHTPEEERLHLEKLKLTPALVSDDEEQGEDTDPAPVGKAGKGKAGKV